ncbi:cytochrome B [Rhizobium sp. Leaf384]|uniref:cytochrome b n=1 Tax=unclassified Rhizobium TaxID=2613769 RepID=UPI00071538E7|nr:MULTISPECIES: cytochrome b/b6 domain-containing protein [unclassified Rhizobium]KQS76643.1 cytochrome B [Rhizobium sp. Leaf383]KQS77911.1 cytochrome B [Rhizobium sp. Leaf384]
MPSHTPPASFSRMQRWLHWATAALVFFNLLLPDGMEAWNRSMKRTGSATADQVASANLHAYVGLAIVAIVLLRLILRMTHGVPSSPAQEPRLFQRLSAYAHGLLYALLLAMPLSGIAAYYFGSHVAGDVHADILKVVLWVLIGGHVLGALAHHFYWKTDVLRRMVRG